jgi:hypothetical protein
LRVYARRWNFADGRLGQDILCDILRRLVDDFMDEADIVLRHSPEAIHKATSRWVISGSTTASRPRRP